MAAPATTPAAPAPTGVLIESLSRVVPLLVVIVVVVIALYGVDRYVRARARARSKEPGFAYQVSMLGLTLSAVMLVVLLAPVAPETRTQLLGVIGLVMTAVLTLSSTTFVSNAMAGLMLRSLNNYRPGDFLRVEKQFGRVTERGLFHTEIQTEDRDLTTIPNLYLVTHPTTVVRSSGTVVSATVSLGYDVPRKRAQELLLQAAADAELADPFVHVTDLGDYSVTYRVAGFLGEVKQVLSARSTLRKRMLDALHDGDIEILSPRWVAQRPTDPGARVIARATRAPEPEELSDTSPEDLIFDKAEQAEQEGALQAEREELAAQLSELIKGSDAPASEDHRHAIETERTRLEARIAEIDAELERADDPGE